MKKTTRNRSVKVVKLAAGRSARVKPARLRSRPAPHRTRAAPRSRLAAAAPAPQPAPPPAAPAPPAVSRDTDHAEPRPGDGTQLPALQLYLREIGQVKLLTPKEEIILARRIKKGDEEAREQMIRANLRLVVKIARDYEGLGLPLLDLINEGNIGLIKGVERFNPAKGAKLSTYAAWWIKQSIKRALADQSKTIRLPVHVVDKVAHIRKAEMKLHELLNREPTDEELATHVGLKPQRVREYREAARAPISLEAPLGNDDDSDRVSEVVADASAAAPFDHIVQSSDTELVREVFATLSPREREVLAMRFGLDDDTPKTLEEIGQHFGVTRERIRQIQNETLKKLRNKVEKRDRPASERLMALVE